MDDVDDEDEDEDEKDEKNEAGPGYERPGLLGGLGAEVRQGRQLELVQLLPLQTNITDLKNKYLDLVNPGRTMSRARIAAIVSLLRNLAKRWV